MLLTFLQDNYREFSIPGNSLADKLEHMLVEISLRCFYPVLFYTYLFKSQLGEKLDADSIISKNITIELVKHQSIETVVDKTLEGH